MLKHSVYECDPVEVLRLAPNLAAPILQCDLSFSVS